MTRATLPLLLCAAICCALAACGGRHGAPLGPGAAPPSLDAPGRADAPATTGAPPSLPTPQALLSAPRDASLYDANLLKNGAAFGPALPHGNVTADGDNAGFAPSWDSAGVHTFANMAYATYQFNAAGYAGAPVLYVGWQVPPDGSANFWLGFANFQKNRWEWLPGPGGGSISVANLLTDNRAPDGRVFVVFLLLGTSPCSLSWTSIGVPAAEAALSATPGTGPPPLAVTLDASASAAPGGITKYEWDYDGDGTYDADTGGTPTTQHTYSAGGRYTPSVRVTAADGGVNTACVPVTVYNEVENNDDTAAPNQLPSLNPAFTRYGSIGSATGYTGYDGDQDDYFVFDANTGDSVTFTLVSNLAAGDIDLYLLDSDGNTLDSSVSTSNPVEVVSHTLAAGDTGPYFIRVKAYSGYSDYSLSGGLGQPPVAALTANPPAGAAPLAVSFDASDSNDPEGQPLAKFEWDFESDGVFDQDTGSVPTVQHTYGASGLLKCTVRVTDANGMTATASATVAVGDIPYDEVENNDDKATANPLPAFGFHGWRGSAGAGGDYAAYDGDEYDYCTFNAATGETVTLFLYLDPAAGDIDLALYDSADRLLDSSTSNTAAVEQVTYTFAAGDTPPFYVRVRAYKGYSDYTLDGIFGAAPTAAITATPQSGELPLSVQLNASGSTDDGSIVKHEWDFDGDGTCDQDTGAVATVQHTYGTPGFFAATARVTDDSGLTDTADVVIGAGFSLDEVENNDSRAQANAFPAFPFSGFAGSCGSGTGYPGDDGDDEDYFRFSAVAGDVADLTLTLPPTHGDLDVQLLDGAGNELGRSAGTGATEHIKYTIQPGDAGPYCLRVYRYSGFSDYMLAGALN
jgi:PKD repeat protein